MGKLIHGSPVKQLIATLLIAACALLSWAANAQVRKCTGPDGKVVYSDFVCAGNTVRESGVKTDANSLDASGLRDESNKIRGDKAVEEAMLNSSTACKFSAYKYGDEKGKALAASAREECLANVAAKATGGKTSKEAYSAWKEHHELTAGKRKAAAANKPLNCIPTGYGQMRCQ